MGGDMKRLERQSFRPLILNIPAVVMCCWIGHALAQPAPAAPSSPSLSYAEQGWTVADRDAFYTTSQGSRMMPYDWYRALRRLDVDEPFGGDQLQRYGYLANER